MAPYEFEVVLRAAVDGGVVAVCPSFPDCPSEGDTVDEAVETLRDALERWSACIDA